MSRLSRKEALAELLKKDVMSDHGFSKKELQKMDNKKLAQVYNSVFEPAGDKGVMIESIAGKINELFNEASAKEDKDLIKKDLSKYKPKMKGKFASLVVPAFLGFDLNVDIVYGENRASLWLDRDGSMYYKDDMEAGSMGELIGMIKKEIESVMKMDDLDDAEKAGYSA